MGRPASLKIASFRGVELKIHLSLLIIVAYLVFVIAARFTQVTQNAGIKPEQLILGDGLGPWVWGTVLAISLFLSVFIHEFGHVLAAQNMGVRVQNITLMMLGGVSQMERIPERPYAEFKLAIVGPLVSLALAGVLFTVRSLTGSPNLAFYCFWLGNANLVLAIFNLLPAFPLDGGRALRSLLAQRNGMLRGTQTAVKVSRAISWILGVLGLLTFNFMLMLIAVFVYAAAQNEQFMVLSRSLLQGLRITDLLVRSEALSEQTSLREAAARMLESRVTLLPVVISPLSSDPVSNASAGMITLNQIRRVPRNYWDVTLVKNVMDPNVRAVDLAEPVVDVVQDITISPSGALPVSDHGQIVGIIRASDLKEILQFRNLEEAA